MPNELLYRQPPMVNGLLGASTMNPNLAAQGRNALASQARGIRPSPFFDPEFYSRDLGPSAASYFSDPENALRALAVAPVPVLSDAAGLAADAIMYKNKPESRNMLNFGLTGLGALPFVPNLAMATAWHGSPHKFDKFDASKIGTGEGAQVYGHGVYFAESPDVAKQYQAALSQRIKSANVDNEVPSGYGLGIAREIASIHNGDVSAFINSNRNYYAQEIENALKAGNARRAEVLKEIAKENEQIASSFMGKKVSAAPDSGSLYKVDIPDEYIPRMLDWDKPLSQQPEVAKAFEKAFNDYAEIFATNPQTKTAFYDAVNSLKSGNMTGEGAYKSLARIIGGKENASTVSNVLRREYGIPGIRYLDQGSRGTGHGTSNFVIFPGNEGAVKILERK